MGGPEGRVRLVGPSLDFDAFVEFKLFNQCQLTGGIAVGPHADKAFGETIKVGPKKRAISVRYGQFIDTLAAEKTEATLVDLWRELLNVP